MMLKSPKVSFQWWFKLKKVIFLQTAGLSDPKVLFSVQFQNIHPTPPTCKGLEFPGAGGFCKTKRCEEMYEAGNWSLIRISEGFGTPFHGEGTYIFWNIHNMW